MVGAGFRDAVRQRARRWTAFVSEAVPSAAVTNRAGDLRAVGSGGGDQPRPLRSSAGHVSGQEERAALPDQACAGRGGDAAARTGTNQELRLEAPSAPACEELAGRTGRAGVDQALSPALSGARRDHARAWARRGATPPTRDWRDSAGRPTVEASTPPTESLGCRRSNNCARADRSRCCKRPWFASTGFFPTDKERSVNSGAITKAHCDELAMKKGNRSSWELSAPESSYRSSSRLRTNSAFIGRNPAEPGWYAHAAIYLVKGGAELSLLLRDHRCSELPHPRLLLGRERGGDGGVQLAAALVDGARHARAPAGKRPTSDALGRARKAVRVERLGGARS